MSKDSQKTLKVACPQCQKSVIWQHALNRPFCSKRCQMIDRGVWASDQYLIADDESYPSESDNE